MTEMSRFSKYFVNRRGGRFYRKLVNTLATEGQLKLSPEAKVLEVGAGNGALSALIYDRFHPTTLNVTDYDQDQVDFAKESLGERYGKLPPAFSLQRVDVLKLPFETGSLDLVLAFQMLHHVGTVEEILRALDEITRVLKPGGQFIYMEMFHKQEIKEHLLANHFEITWCKKRWQIVNTAEIIVAKNPLAPGRSPGA
jgi:ubiquinone/menaquinone biosynthesis C-methylase UbiE